MNNLARKQNPGQDVINDVDRRVVRELERCGIPVMAVDEGGVEVPYRHIGKLDDFTFRRAWSYWMVHGPVPLPVAEELYKNRIGKTDVRVAGHCGCPAPEYPWVDYFSADGRRIYKTKPSAEEQNREEAALDKHYPDWRDESVYLADPAAEAVRAFVMNYHIDTELGLYIFVAALRNHRERRVRKMLEEYPRRPSDAE